MCWFIIQVKINQDLTTRRTDQPRNDRLNSKHHKDHKQHFQIVDNIERKAISRERGQGPTDQLTQEVLTRTGKTVTSQTEIPKDLTNANHLKEILNLKLQTRRITLQKMKLFIPLLIQLKHSRMLNLIKTNDLKVMLRKLCQKHL